MSVNKEFEEARKLVMESSFDGWIENDGPNCNEDGACQMLKQSIVLDILTHLQLGIEEAVLKAVLEGKKEGKHSENKL